MDDRKNQPELPGHDGGAHVVQGKMYLFEKGEITKFTIGYVLDKETGNTGGLGGVFGLFYACGVGLPFPEAQPWQPSPIYGSLMSVNKAIQGVFKANPDVKKTTFDVLTTIGKAVKGDD